jgi:tetratricopeptide (TPR) repeat protein
MDQLDLFSEADKHLENAHNALLETDFSAAKKELQTARSINPFLANLDATNNVVDYFQKFHKRAKNTADALAAVFRDIPDAVQKNRLLIREAELVEQVMAHMAIKQVKMSKPFVDTAKVLHWGYCFTVTRQFTKAEKAFKETLQSPKEQRADLWGFFGDLCYLMSDQRQANSAYIRSLLVNPQEIDLYRIKSTAIKLLYRQLLEQHKEQEARGLLLFEGWCQSIFNFIRAGRSTDPQPEPFQALLKKPLPKDKPGKLFRFSIHFYIDQMNAKVDVDNREKMQTLDKVLFQRYLEMVQGKEK